MEVDRAFVRENWQREGHDVYLRGRDVGGRRVVLVPHLQMFGDRATLEWTGEPLDEATAAVDPTPALWLPAGGLSALMVAAAPHLQPARATAEHLADAIAVRDRITGMLERAVLAPAPVETRIEARPR